MLLRPLKNREKTTEFLSRKSLSEVYRKILRDYATVITGTSFSRGLSFLSSILVARWLGAEAFGVYALFFITSTLTWQFAQSFDITFIRKAKNLQDKEVMLEFLRATLILKAVYCIVALVIAGFVSKTIAAHLFLKPDLSYALFYGIVSGVFVAFLRTRGALYQLNERYGLYSLNYLVYSGSIFMGLCGAWIFYPAMAVHGVILVTTVISVAIGLGSVLHLLIGEVKPKPCNPKVLLDSFRFGKWVFGVTFLYSLFVRLDVLVIARFVDFRELGIYSAAAQIIMILSLFTGAMSGIFLPKSIQAVTSKERMSRYFHEAALPVGVILVSIVGLFIFSPILVQFCFGNEYGGAVLLLRVLLIGWIFQAVYLPLQYIFYGINKTQFRFFLEIFKVIILFSLLSIMVPAFGVVGGAWAISLVYAVNFSIVSYSLFKAYRTIQNTRLSVQIQD